MDKDTSGNQKQQNLPESKAELKQEVLATQERNEHEHVKDEPEPQEKIEDEHVDDFIGVTKVTDNDGVSN